MEKAIYLSDSSDNLIELSKKLCLTSILLDTNDLNQDIIPGIKKDLSDISISVRVEVFSGKDLIDSVPSSLPQEATNKETKYESYYGVCPNNEEIRNLKLKKIGEIIANQNVSAIWLDSLFYPTYWSLPEPLIFDTCYCQTCMKKFSDFIYGEKLPSKLEDLVDAIDGQYYIEWLEFKCKTITSFVTEVKELISKSQKDIKLGAFIVPWIDKEYGSANTRILGQNLTDLSEHLDFISPILYFKTLGKDLTWVSTSLEYYSVFGIKVIPCIFSPQESSSISKEEFDKVLDNVLAKPAEGALVMDFSTIANTQPKFAALKERFCK